jgi:hypothetical protein
VSKEGKKMNERLRSIARQAAQEKGDVPGWVLITLMTAALVVVIWTVAAPALTEVFNQAMDKVVSF